MPKSNKKNKRSVRHMVEDRKLRKYVKNMNRTPLELVECKDGYLPKGFYSMTKAQLATNEQRQRRHAHLSKKPQPQDAIRVSFMFTPNELGVPPPSPEEIMTMHSVNPKVAKMFKYFNELEHVKMVPTTIPRSQHSSFKQQWKDKREEVKQGLIAQRIEMEQQIVSMRASQDKIQYDPDGPTTLNLDNLTTVTTQGEDS